MQVELKQLGALKAAHYTWLLNTLTLYMAALGRTEDARRTDSGALYTAA